MKNKILCSLILIIPVILFVVLFFTAPFPVNFISLIFYFIYIALFKRISTFVMKKFKIQRRSDQ